MLKEASFELGGDLVILGEFKNTVKRVLRQRKHFLESELSTRWDFPLHGSLGPYEYATRSYANELGASLQLLIFLKFFFTFTTKYFKVRNKKSTVKI